MFTVDRLKIVAAVLIVILGVGGFYYFSDKTELARVLILAGAGVVAVTLFFLTAQGRAVWEFMKEARLELRKVVWPTRKETTQMTMVVVGLVVIAAAFLWIIDWSLIKAIHALSGQRS